MRNYVTTARFLRNLCGYSQAYVAFELGVSQSLYCKIENNKVRLTVDFIENICNIYGLSVDDFLTKDHSVMAHKVVDSQKIIGINIK